mmetsp:Transcript_4594/g.5181  ORF Transcript_4594/g.5181 Transcript_4594/m.5181 type:complete len:103 (+) Transcript_4594:238-546(+)
MVTTLTVVGYPSCPYYQKSVSLARHIETKNSDKFRINIISKSTGEYREWVREFKATAENNHTTSPSVFIGEEKAFETFIGGNDDFHHWARSQHLKRGSCTIS